LEEEVAEVAEVLEEVEGGVPLVDVEVDAAEPELEQDGVVSVIVLAERDMMIYPKLNDVPGAMLGWKVGRVREPSD